MRIDIHFFLRNFPGPEEELLRCAVILLTTLNVTLSLRFPLISRERQRYYSKLFKKRAAMKHLYISLVKFEAFPRKHFQKLAKPV